MNGILRRVAVAAGIAAILIEWVAESLAELDDALSEYLVEDRCPDYVPEALVVDE